MHKNRAPPTIKIENRTTPIIKIENRATPTIKIELRMAPPTLKIELRMGAPLFYFFFFGWAGPYFFLTWPLFFLCPSPVSSVINGNIVVTSNMSTKRIIDQHNVLDKVVKKPKILPWEHVANAIPEAHEVEIRLMINTLLLEDKLKSRTFKMFGKTCVQPRKSCTMGACYTYSGIRQEPVPITDEMTSLLTRLQVVTGIPYLELKDRLGIVINWYDSGDEHIGWHSDDEPCIDQTYAITSVSFGAARDFKIRNKTDPGLTYTITLGNCDILIMYPGMQSEYKHSLPKRKSVNKARCNITIRILKK